MLPIQAPAPHQGQKIQDLQQKKLSQMLEAEPMLPQILELLPIKHNNEYLSSPVKPKFEQWTTLLMLLRLQGHQPRPMLPLTAKLSNWVLWVP